MAKDSNPTRRSPTVEELEHALQDVSSAETASLLANIKLATLRQLRRDPNKIQSATEIVGSKVIDDLAVQLSAEQARFARLLPHTSRGQPYGGEGTSRYCGYTKSD